MTRRVGITGIGLLTPVGNDTASSWKALVAGRSGVAPITRFDASGMDVKIAAEVKGFDPLAVYGPQRGASHRALHPIGDGWREAGGGRTRGSISPRCPTT